MIIVTGGVGFVGSNLIKGLNEQGYSQILVVDNMGNNDKFKNLVALQYEDYLDKEDFSRQLTHDAFTGTDITTVFHIGACSDTMEKDGNYMMRNNYEFSKVLLEYCVRRKIPFIYASSASVYGNGKQGFYESEECEGALNVYAFSKMAFDRYVKKQLSKVESQVVGLRYFNVFGPQENHKGKMASIIYQLYNQVKQQGSLRLFAGTDGYGNGEQRRDFIYIKDVVKVNLFFQSNPQISGIFNCGTGKASSFNEIANNLIAALGAGKIEYTPFPESLLGKYQSFTQADITKLIATGYSAGFMPLKEAIEDYYYYLQSNQGYLK